MSDENKSRIAKKIEVAANVAIILAALVVIVAFIRSYSRSSPEVGRKISAGEKFRLNSVNWTNSEKTVVLGISTTCHFCTESAGFYRQLVEECKQRRVPVIAVLPQTVSEAQSYLKNEGVAVDEIRQASLPDLDIAATPTLLLVDGRGTVSAVWFGKLSGDGEKDVLSKLSQ